MTVKLFLTLCLTAYHINLCLSQQCGCPGQGGGGGGGGPQRPGPMRPGPGENPFDPNRPRPMRPGPMRPGPGQNPFDPNMPGPMRPGPGPMRPGPMRPGPGGRPGGPGGFDPRMMGRRSVSNDTLPPNSYRVGDMVFTAKDTARMNGFRATMATARDLWPQGKLFWNFGQFPEQQKNDVRQQLREFNDIMQGCVSFEEGTGGGHYVNVVGTQQGCFSMIGRVTAQGPQLLNLDPSCQGGVVKHEFMHALGFYHEQMRPDRDTAITINWSNIMTPMCSQFETCKGCRMVTDYDPKSIMQYDSSGFSCNRQPTMVLKSGGLISYNHHLSESDKKQIRDLYQCK